MESRFAGGMGQMLSGAGRVWRCVPEVGSIRVRMRLQHARGSYLVQASTWPSGLVLAFGEEANVHRNSD